MKEFWFVFKNWKRVYLYNGKYSYKFVGFWFLWWCIFESKEQHRITAQGFVRLFGRVWLKVGYKNAQRLKKLLDRKPQEKIVKGWRSDIKKWETKTWYGWLYEAWGEKPQRRLFRKSGQTKVLIKPYTWHTL